MSFLSLPIKQYEKAHNLYNKEKFFFPLIGVVLSCEQDGVVYVDNPYDPTAVYVEHSFGFAQLFGEKVPSFEKALEQYLLHDRSFSPAKVRFYAPVVPEFLTAPELRSLQAERQRLFPTAIPAALPLEAPSADITITRINATNVKIIHDNFGVVDRFWRSSEEFVHNSHAVLAFVKGEPAALCYAAAIASNKAEIDSLTLSPFRGQGLGKLVMRHFIHHCREHSLTPLTDVFTNNIASMAMCASVGYKAEQPPYILFTIPKQP